MIADCVNDWQIARDAWQAVGRRACAEIMWVEVVCSDPAEHQRRVKTRTSDVVGLVLPDWAAVVGREYHAWDQERLVVDTAGRDVDVCVGIILAGLANRP